MRADGLHDIPVQGPKASDVLDAAASSDIAAFPCFRGVPTT
jgi:glycine cleavage system aminomethyltransferase T